MNKINIIGFIILLTISCTKNDVVENKTSSTYLPLAKGNIWSYELNGWRSDYIIDCPCYPVKGFINHKIIKDTLINNKTFFVLNIVGKIDTTSITRRIENHYLKYDVENSKLFEWDFENNKEQLLVDYSAEINIPYEGYRIGPNIPEYHYETKKTSESDTLFFGRTGKKISFEEVYYFETYRYSYFENIGLISQYYQNELETYEMELIGYKIDDSIVGDISNVD